MLRRQKSIAILAIVTCASATRGGLIEGPIMTSDISGNSRWGIQFTALKTSWLRGFDYEVQDGIAGRVELHNITTPGMIFSNDHAAATDRVEYRGLSILLLAGQDYQLVGVDATTTNNNGRFAAYSNYGASASISDEIDVTTGVQNSGTNSGLWFSFRNVETEAVSEPGTLGLCALLTGAFYARRCWRRRKLA